MVTNQNKITEVKKTKLRLWLKFLRDRKGATAIEYGLMAALIGVAIIGGARTLGQSLNNQLNCVASAVASNSPGKEPRKKCKSRLRPQPSGPLTPAPAPAGPRPGAPKKG